MKFTALHLLFLVVGFELLIGGAVVVKCIVSNDKTCTDGRVSDLFNSIAASSFAIYAAEKSTLKR